MAAAQDRSPDRLCGRIDAELLKTTLIAQRRFNHFNIIPASLVCQALQVDSITYEKLEGPVDHEDVVATCYNSSHASINTLAREFKDDSPGSDSFFDGLPPTLPRGDINFHLCCPMKPIKSPLHSCVVLSPPDTGPYIAYLPVIERIRQLIDSNVYQGDMESYIGDIKYAINSASANGRDEFRTKLQTIIDNFAIGQSEKIFPPKFLTVVDGLTESAKCLRRLMIQCDLEITTDYSRVPGSVEVPGFEVPGDYLCFVKNIDPYHTSGKLPEGLTPNQRLVLNRGDAFSILARVVFNQNDPKTRNGIRTFVTFSLNRTKLGELLLRPEYSTFVSHDGKYRVQYFGCDLVEYLSTDFFTQGLDQLIKEFQDNFDTRMQQSRTILKTAQVNKSTLQGKLLRGSAADVQKTSFDDIMDLDDVINKESLAIENMEKSNRNFLFAKGAIDYFKDKLHLCKLVIAHLGCREQNGFATMDENCKVKNTPVVFGTVVPWKGYTRPDGKPVILYWSQNEKIFFIIHFDYEVKLPPYFEKVDKVDELLKLHDDHLESSLDVEMDSIPKPAELDDASNDNEEEGGEGDVEFEKMKTMVNVLNDDDDEIDAVRKRSGDRTNLRVVASDDDNKLLAKCTTDLDILQDGLNRDNTVSSEQQPNSRVGQFLSKTKNVLREIGRLLPFSLSLWSPSSSPSEEPPLIQYPRAQRRAQSADAAGRGGGGGGDRSRRVSRKHTVYKKRRSTYMARCIFGRKKSYRDCGCRGRGRGCGRGVTRRRRNTRRTRKN